jgi:hypothetical protein
MTHREQTLARIRADLDRHFTSSNVDYMMGLIETHFDDGLPGLATLLVVCCKLADQVGAPQIRERLLHVCNDVQAKWERQIREEQGP